MKNFDPDLQWYYSRGKESGRLDTESRLEAERTKRIISRRLTGNNLSVIDIGGGPGYYAFWLTSLGHEVHLIDPVPEHLEQANERARSTNVQLAGAHIGIAQELPFENASFDVALLLGPLYHLTDRSERLKALREAGRVLRPGGIIFAAAISRYAAVVDGFFADYVSQPGFKKLMHSTMQNGEWQNPSRVEGLFTTSYFHRPDELASEMTESGFTDPEILAVEGVWTWIPGLAEKWKDEEYREFLMETLDRLESDQSVVGLGGHLMGVGRLDGDK